MILRPSYPLNQCYLFSITSPGALAKRLGTPLDVLESLAASSENYRIRWQETKPGKRRLIEEPKPVLQAIHGRVHRLLSRVDLPDYVHSVRKGRSYLTNAAAHIGAESMIKLDIKGFYQRSRSGAVADFWTKRMNCRPDAAGLLTSLITYEGHLPTGSKSSPIMSYWAYEAMFNEIHSVVGALGLKLTLYVDDMVISGVGAHKGVLREVAAVIARHGLHSHKRHHFAGSSPRPVTGVLAAADCLLVPLSRDRNIKGAWNAFHAQSTTEGKLEAMNTLCSMLHEVAQIDPARRPAAERAERLRKQLRLGLTT